MAETVDRPPRRSENLVARPLLWVLVLALVTMLALDAGAEEDKRYAAALAALRRKDFQEGVKLYYKFIVLADPSLSNECRKRDLAGAFEYFSERRKKDPTDNRALYFLSLIDRNILRMDRAGKQLDEVRNKFPKSLLLTFVKGEYCLIVENIAEATQFFLRLKETPSAKKLWAVASFLMKRSGLEEKGLERKAALLKKAFRHLDLMERDQAEQVLKAVMKGFPDDPEAPRALADMYMEMKKFTEAESLVEEWKKRTGRSPLTPLQEGRLWYSQGRYAEVIKVLDPLFKREPGNEYAGMFLAESYFQTGDYQRAVDLYKGFYEGDPGNVSMAIRYATSLECTGRGKEGIATLEKTAQKNPRDLFIQLELGGLYERLGKLVDAAGYYRKVAFEQGPLQEIASQKLGAIYRKTLEDNPAFSGSQTIDVTKPLPPIPPTANVAPPKTQSEQIKAVAEHQQDLNKSLSNVFK